MLDQISEYLTGDLLKLLCDMGHGDTIVLADANFPLSVKAEHYLQMSGVDVTTLLEAMVPVFPIDVQYTEHPGIIMELTPGDKARNLPRPEAWADYERVIRTRYPEFSLHQVERQNFYTEARKAYAVIQTGEKRIYGNLLLTKGCVIK